jgi:hypothetical protein
VRVDVVAEDLPRRQGERRERRALGVALRVEVETVAEEMGEVTVSLGDVERAQIRAAGERLVGVA